MIWRIFFLPDGMVRLAPKREKNGVPMGDGQHRQRRPDTQPEEGLSRYLDSIPFPFQTSLRSHFYQMPLFRPFKTSLLTFSYFRIAFVVLLFYCTFVLFAKWAKKAKRKKKYEKEKKKICLRELLCFLYCFIAFLGFNR